MAGKLRTECLARKSTHSGDHRFMYKYKLDVYIR